MGDEEAGLLGYAQKHHLSWISAHRTHPYFHQTMTQTIFTAEPLIRLSVFAGVFALVAFWEVMAPRRAQEFSRKWRWPNNLGVLVLDTLLVRFFFPTAAVGIALLGEQRGWGLLNNIALPVWTEVVLAVIALDLVIYFQHVLFHAVPAFWRLHRMHHADLEFDASTGIRFHPIEVLLSMVIKLAAVAALGAPAVGVLVFEVLLNAISMFNHGNVRLSRRLDAMLRWVVVTPEMHRVHHSIEQRETNSNFGFNLPWWDRMFGTYRPEPETGHENMTIGVPEFRDRSELRLDKMLFQPLRKG